MGHPWPAGLETVVHWGREAWEWEYRGVSFHWGICEHFWFGPLSLNCPLVMSALSTVATSPKEGGPAWV